MINHAASGVIVVIPTYNERLNLSSTVARLRRAVPAADVLVVDDNSPDGTGQLADSLAANDQQVHVLHRPKKEGLGPAYIAGFRWALTANYDILVEMDADGSHQPEQLDRLLNAVVEADVAIGARWMPGGDVQQWSWSRTWLSRGGNAYIRASLGMPLRDATSGFRAYRASVLRQIPLGRIASAGYCFQADLTRQVFRSGALVVEVPITFVERTAGASKMSRAIMFESLLRVTAWGLADRGRQLVRALLRV
ncbi:MAG: polyprenol monophosphomannose synthase [Antricoccus sp.]